MRVRARHAGPGSPGDTEERHSDAGAGFGEDGLAGSNRILVRLCVAVVSPHWQDTPRSEPTFVENVVRH